MDTMNRNTQVLYTLSDYITDTTSVHSGWLHRAFQLERQDRDITHGWHARDINLSKTHDAAFINLRHILCLHYILSWDMFPTESCAILAHRILLVAPLTR
jgi:hypothetical protein